MSTAQPQTPKHFFAHTKEDVDGKPLPQSEWEPLFTPDCPTLRKSQISDLQSQISDPQSQNPTPAPAQIPDPTPSQISNPKSQIPSPCPHCAALDPTHGHLNKVAHLAAKFAGEMFAPESTDAQTAAQWGHLAGLWHDLGKFSVEFQAYLLSANDTHQADVSERVDHATAGAKLAAAKPPFGHIIANAIAGHHSGLLDTRNTGACLQKRLVKETALIDHAPADLTGLIPPAPLEFLSTRPNDFSISFFQRMLFSCLVDADFLATETFMNSEQAALRQPNKSSVFEDALDLLQTHIGNFGTPATTVDHARTSVYQDCLENAGKSPGLFKLTVPTGGGKTLSSLAFALKHALTHGQRRIIYVIPFTSIIEQNAEVFKELLSELGSEVVLEHHSNLSPEKETNHSRLACENWDAPIVVTTAVQFYESLFAAQTSRSRKLHNIANAVIILDEAQSLPVQYLAPCLRVLEQLTENYHTTAVLCTATQPAIEKHPLFPIGLNGATEIVSDTQKLFQSLDRVRVTYRGTLDDAAVSHEINSAEQALCIVNTRKHAQALYALLPKGEENFHLSTLMCPEHRLRILAQARDRLEAGQSVRLISTQLIEAGVDIDFPLVFRSMAGLDSIAQAAGRCNRNGNLEKGHVHVFLSEHLGAERYFRETASVGHEILDLHADDPLSTESIRAYFDKYYYQQKSKWDAKEIMDDFKCVADKELPLLFQYRTVSDKFRLIENHQISIIIPWDAEAIALIQNELRNDSIPLHRRLLRNLQRYTIQIYENAFRQNAAQFESLRDGQFHVLICPETHYSEDLGLKLEPNSPTTLIC